MNIQVASEWNIEIQRRRATLLNRLLSVTFILSFAAQVPLFFALRTVDIFRQPLMLFPLIAGWLATLIAWLWPSIRYSTRTVTLLVVFYVLGIILSAQGRSPGSGLMWLVLPPVLAFALLGPQAIIASGVTSILIYGFLHFASYRQWVIPQANGVSDTLVALVIEGGSFLAVIVILTVVLRSFDQGWSKALADATGANRRLQALAGEFEETIARLRRQVSHLHATADIAHAGSSVLDPEDLLGQSVDRIQEGFSQSGVYYVGLFLLNEAQRVAVLRAATGEAGKLLLEMGYKVDVGDTSTVSRCIAHRQARISCNAREGTLRFDALPMPHARSEIALPLRSRGRILGALSMASTQDNAFSEADIAVLQTMADQVAVAIDNAVLYSQTKAALEQLQATQRRYMAQAWSKFLATRPMTPADYAQAGAAPGDSEFLQDARRAAMEHERTVATTSPPPDSDGNGTTPGNHPKGATPQSALVVPLKLRGQVIGTLALHETGHQRVWTAEEIALAETVAEQVAMTTDNLRLMDETQRRADRERMVGEVTADIRETLDMETVIKTATQEIRQALGLPHLRIRLAVEDAGNGISPG